MSRTDYLVGLGLVVFVLIVLLGKILIRAIEIRELLSEIKGILIERQRP